MNALLLALEPVLPTGIYEARTVVNLTDGGPLDPTARERQARYLAKPGVRARVAARMRDWRKRNRAELLKREAAKRAANPEYFRQKQREYRARERAKGRIV